MSSTFCTTVFPCILSAYVNFTSVRRTICHLFLWRIDIPSIFVRPQDSLSIFSASVGLSVNFHQLSVRPLNFPSTSINIPCGHVTFCQLLSTFRAAAKPSVNFTCIHITFRQLVSTFCASAGHSVNFPFVHGTFRELFLWYRELQSTFFVSAQPSVNFCHLSIFCWTFCKLTLNFRASEGSSVNFLCIHGTFCKLLSTFLESAGPFIRFPYDSGTFH